MPQSDPQKPDLDSKSHRKKEMTALQKIGESLIKLTAEQLATIDLPDNLQLAIKQIKSLHSNEAKRRQLQYIGKIMRQIDSESIKQALKRIEFMHDTNTAHFHHVEEWRTKLLMQGDDALNQFLIDYPQAERQQLRQLIRSVHKDKKNNKNTGAEKTLFKYLRAMLDK